MGIHISLNIDRNPSAAPPQTQVPKADTGVNIGPEESAQELSPRAPQGFLVSEARLPAELGKNRVYAVWFSSDRAYHGLHFRDTTTAYHSLKKACGWGGLRSWKRLDATSSEEATALFLEGCREPPSPIRVFLWQRASDVQQPGARVGCLC
jgi:hypothetical protein